MTSNLVEVSDAKAIIAQQSLLWGLQPTLDDEINAKSMFNLVESKYQIVSCKY